MSAQLNFPNPTPPPADEPSRPCKVFQYAVKLVSGRPTSAPQLMNNIIAPGQYYTAINIHNPSSCKAVTFRWWISIANRISDPMGLITRPSQVTIRPEQSVEIDTPDIFRATNQQAFSKGFVIIETPCELDVVAVYTTATSQTPPPQALGALVAFHTERVPARNVESCGDELVLDLSTGVAEWMLTAAVGDPNQTPLPIATPRPASVVEAANMYSVWVAQPGTKWISVLPFANVSNLTQPGFVPGYYTFQTCFHLCAGFENAALQLAIRNDNDAVVWFNDQQVGSQLATNLNGPPTTSNITQPFLPGINCLSIVVNNTNVSLWPNPPNPNPVGLDIKATMTALRGACPGCGCCCNEAKSVR